MAEVLRTNDLIFLGFAEALLRDAGLDPLVLDGYASAAEGSISAIPRRLMVPEHQAYQAKRVMAEAGFSDTVSSDG